MPQTRLAKKANKVACITVPNPEERNEENIVRSYIFMNIKKDQAQIFQTKIFSVHITVFNYFTIHTYPDKFENKTLSRPKMNGTTCTYNGRKGTVTKITWSFDVSVF